MRKQPPPHAPKGGESFTTSPRDCMMEDPEQKGGTRRKCDLGSFWV